MSLLLMLMLPTLMMMLLLLLPVLILRLLLLMALLPMTRATRSSALAASLSRRSRGPICN